MLRLKDYERLSRKDLGNINPGILKEVNRCVSKGCIWEALKVGAIRQNFGYNRQRDQPDMMSGVEKNRDLSFGRRPEGENHNNGVFNRQADEQGLRKGIDNNRSLFSAKNDWSGQQKNNSGWQNSRSNANQQHQGHQHLGPTIQQPNQNQHSLSFGNTRTNNLFKDQTPDQKHSNQPSFSNTGQASTACQSQPLPPPFPEPPGINMTTLLSICFPCTTTPNSMTNPAYLFDDRTFAIASRTHIESRGLPLADSKSRRDIDAVTPRSPARVTPLTDDERSMIRRPCVYKACHSNFVPRRVCDAVPDGLCRVAVINGRVGKKAGICDDDTCDKRYHRASDIK